MAYENQEPRTTNGTGHSNRFAFKVGHAAYADKAEYLKAMSEQLTPDVWPAIVARAIHDATVGRKQERAKAREWFAKYILPFKTEIALRTETGTAHDFLSEIYNIFQQGARSAKDVEEALAGTLGSLKPEERATLKAALTKADSEEVQTMWEQIRAESKEDANGDRSTGGNRTY